MCDVGLEVKVRWLINLSNGWSVQPVVDQFKQWLISLSSGW